MLCSPGTGRRRAMQLVALLLVVGTAGAAATGASSPPRSTFTISGDVAGLYPGGQRTANLRVTNRYPWTIDVRGITVTSTTTNRIGCSPHLVTSPGWSGVQRVRAGRSVTIPVPVRMSPQAPGACQGATFRLVYTGWGVRT